MPELLRAHAGRPLAGDWSKVALNCCRRIPYAPDAESERVRQLRRVALEADNLAAILEQRFTWPPKGQGR